VAESVTTIGEQTATATDTSGTYRSFEDVMNPHDDGISLDVFVDWLIAAGRDMRRIDDHDEWLGRFETALRALPDNQRQHSLLPLLDAYRKPETPLRGRKRRKSVQTKTFRTYRQSRSTIPLGPAAAGSDLVR